MRQTHYIIQVIEHSPTLPTPSPLDSARPRPDPTDYGLARTVRQPKFTFVHISDFLGIYSDNS